VDNRKSVRQGFGVSLEGIQEKPDSFSPREWEVLELVVQGSTNREIADRLSISEGTVRRYVRTILEKLQMDTRVAAAAKAFRTR
jgi:DNA-binding NarL/FixJ family response regulator